MAKHLSRKHEIEPPVKETDPTQQIKITSVESAKIVPIDSMLPSEKKRNDRLLARFIVCSNVPTRTVDMEEFRDFISSLNSTYIVPSRGTINSLVSEMFEATI